MILKVLGCGDAFASGGRFNTSFLLKSNDKTVLIDCGASTLIKMKQEGYSSLDIDEIIITHFHGDHYGGIPFQIISNRFEHARTKTLTIFGPEGIRQKLFSLQEAMYPGTGELLEENHIRIVEVVSDQWWTDQHLSILYVPVKHAPPSNPHGVKLKIDEKVFAFSGDTEWTDALLNLAEDSDLFICECNNMNDESPGHLSYKSLEERRHLFNTKRMMFSHMGTQMLEAPKLNIERLEDGMEVSF